MADKLIFPIGFDLESGLKAAEGDFNRVARQIENAIKRNPVKVPIGFDEATAKRLREEAKDIERVLANIKNHYGSGQLKGLSIGFINTQKEIEGIRRLEAQLQTLQQQRTALVNAGATIQELNKIDAAIRGTEFNLKALTRAFNKDMSSNVAITQQITKLKQLSEELAGIDRMYARLQASASAANRPVNSFEANEMLVRRREIMEEIARVTRTATEAQKELFNIKGVGVGASQGVFGIGGEQGLSAITEQISRYETLKKQLQEVEGQYERLKAMQAQGMGDQSEKINQTLQRRIAIQKELGEITQTAAQAQKELEKKAQATAAAFQRGRGAIENFNRVMKLPENRIMNIQQKINLLNQALKRVGINSAEYGKITMELARLGRKLDEAKAKQEALTGAQKKSGAEGSRAFREQSSYLSILIKRLAVYASFDAVNNFLTKVREVTAQFELQRISLGAIINDQARANMLFNEIKQFALKSPIKILDLTKYTKQLAAFRFETDTLFDTTKRMADISVGLSVPMDRLILALGHVKASTYLTGITLRQFSMAGIPMLELLAERFTELEGRAVSTADVVKRVHDKLVSFEDVNQVLIGLTEKGGMFYDMQEKQGNTLYGLWEKLGDAASVMYDQIGNTAAVNKGMKSAIDTLTVMMRNWRDVARIATEAGIAFAVYRLAVIASTKATALATVWEKKDIVLRQMHLKTIMAQSWSIRTFNAVLLKCGVSMDKAATSTWIFSRALNGIRGAIAKTGIGAMVIALGLLIDHLLFSKSAAEQLKESLDNIETESIQEQDKSVRNFERLANIAVSASSTYKEQQSALEELKRTYKEIIPQEQLTIENLKQMNGNYELLTASIRKYVAEQMKQKQTDEIINTSSYEILKIQRKVNNELKDKYSYEQLTAFWDKYAEIVKDSSKSAGKSVSELINLTTSAIGADLQFAHDVGSVWTLFAYDHADVSRMTTLLREQERQIDALSKTYDASTMAMGEYAESYNKAVESITQNGVKLNGTIINEDDNPLTYSQQVANLEIKDAMIPTIKEAFDEAGLTFDDGWVSIIDNINENIPSVVSTIDFTSMIEKVESESDKLLDALQIKLDALVAQREAYLNQIKAEEAKGKSKNEDLIKQTTEQYDKLGGEIEKLQEKSLKINIVIPMLNHLSEKYKEMAPSDPVVKMTRQRFDQIVDYTKEYAKNMRRFRMSADEDLEAYRKRLSEEVELIKKNIKAWSAAMVWARLFRDKTEEQNLQNLIDEAKLQLGDLEKMLGEIPVFEKKKSKGTKSDNRLQYLQEIVRTVESAYNEFDTLSDKIGESSARLEVMSKYADTFADLAKVASKYGFKIEIPKDFDDLPQSAAELAGWLDSVEEYLAGAGKKISGADKYILEIGRKQSDVLLKEWEKMIDKELKELADRISRTKTAKEFYEKILGMTGDVELAANLAVSVYGQNGQDLQDAIREQITSAFESGKEGVEVDLSEAIDPDTGAINYNKLAELEEKYKDVLIDGRADLRKKLIDEGRKTSEAQVQQWLKDIEKAKDFAQQRIDLATYTANQIAAINAREDLPQAEKDKLIKGYQNREAKQLAKLQYDEFKDSAMYVHIFEDLDHASTTALKNMRDRLVALKGQWKNLDPTQVKELTKAIADLDEQIAGRSPFKSILDGFKGLADARPQKVIDAEMIAATDELAKREEALAAATKKLTEAQTAQVNAQAEVAQARQNLEDALAVSGGEETAEVKAAREVLGIKIATFNAVKAASKDSISAAKEEVDKAADKYEEQKKIIDKLVEEGKLREANIKKIELANQKIDEYQSQINEALDGIRKMMEAFGASEEDMQFFDDVVGALNEIVDAGQQAAMSVASFMSGNILGGITSGISAMGGLVSGFTNLFSAGKVRRANKEIKRQQELLEQLDYTYGRLEKAADKLFGRDYVNNYNQQLKNLQAQQEAYLKQAQAERSKGKKEDKEKTKEYEEQARETADKIKELQDDLVAHFTGSTKTDAARQMAKSWIDARASMSDTFAAIKGDYADMIKNMIVEGAAARVIENALSPVWDSMQKMLDKNDVQGAIDSLISGMDAALSQANNGMEVLWKALEARGYDMKQLIGDTDSEYTGIAKSVAGASSEEINNVAAIGNTVMYHTSFIPQIYQELVAMRSVSSPTSSDGSGGWTDWQRQAMDNYNAIARNTADTVVECRRAAVACEAAVKSLDRVTFSKGSVTGLNVFLKK